MFQYQTVVCEDHGTAESGPDVRQYWVDQKGRSAEDATRRYKNEQKALGYKSEVKFTEADKLVGEALEEFRRWNVQADGWDRCHTEDRF